MAKELVEQLITCTKQIFDKTELLSMVSVLEIILLKPTLTLLHRESHIWKFIISLELCNRNISCITHDDWFLNVTISQKFRFSFKTNIQTKAIYWTSGICSAKTASLNMFGFSLSVRSAVVLDASFVMLWLLSLVLFSNVSLHMENESLINRLIWGFVCFLYLKDKILQESFVCGFMAHYISYAICISLLRFSAQSLQCFSGHYSDEGKSYLKHYTSCLCVHDGA